MSSLPSDYLERVYAGVLGKLIGVYLGRPFENWTYREILDRLGPINYYVHDKLGMPLVVVDDDVSGTFAFVRALEEHGARSSLTSEEIGKTWLNNVIEKRCIFWWGGNGISTEHTAFRNLKKGISAPDSGSILTNGQTVAEQIGAQIFIDGWALVAPGQPKLAAQLAEAAARVSHDGEAVHAAKMWAAMEAEAFVSKDVDHLLDTGLKFIPPDSLIARLITDVRNWSESDSHWEKTRQRIEDSYGYDKYHGICHVVPNHGIMIMALIYAAHDFHKAMHIINTCGWDTDCNSGNIGCLVAIINGLDGFEGGPDWRSPLADRALVSSADGGYSINNAARIAFDIASTGCRLAGEEPLLETQDGAQFHFTLPGSVQGFQAISNGHEQGTVKVEQDMQSPTGPALAIRLKGLKKDFEPVEILTPTFTPMDVLKVERHYKLMASPLVYPGQTIKVKLRADKSNTAAISATIRLKSYNPDDELVPTDSSPTTLAPGDSQILTWIIPETLENQPIQQLGIALAAQEDQLDGILWLDSVKYHGTPHITLRRPSTGPADLWHRSWVNGVDTFHTFGPSFFIAHDSGEGMISHGCRDWHDYRVTVSKFKVNLGAPAGVAVRVRGLNRYYALTFVRGGRVVLVKARDEKRIELAGGSFDWRLDEMYEVSVTVEGSRISGSVGGVQLAACDEEYEGGGIGLIVTDGSLSADGIAIVSVDG